MPHASLRRCTLPLVEFFSIVFPDSLRIRNKILLIQSVRNLHAVLAEFSNFNCPVRLDSHLSVCPCVCRKYQGPVPGFLADTKTKRVMSSAVTSHHRSHLASHVFAVQVRLPEDIQRSSATIVHIALSCPTLTRCQRRSPRYCIAHGCTLPPRINVTLFLSILTNI